MTKPYPTPPPIRVLLADDHPLVRAGLQALLCATPRLELVASVSSSDEAIRGIIELTPDVAVVDYMLGPENGLAVAAAAGAHPLTQRVKVLLLSGSTDANVIERMITGGAAGAVHKSSPTHELITAIFAVAQGGTHFCNEMLALRKPDARSQAAAIESLTQREREVFARIAQGHANDSIAHSLNIHHDTVRTHRKNLMAKLNCHNAAQLTSLAIRHGFISA